MLNSTSNTHLYNVFECGFNFNLLGCNKQGFYGRTCEIRCPINCKYSKCLIQNGDCLDCKPGWNGTHCDASKNLFFISGKLKITIRSFSI